MLDRVTNHACLRYMERVLGHPVETWLAGRSPMREADKVALCCNLAGLTVNGVRELVLHPAVLRMIACGFRQVTVRLDGFAYVIQDGKVITVLAGYMRDTRLCQSTKLKTQTRAEARKTIIRREKRHRGRRRQFEVA
ncbi:hypothetical protein C8J32_10426 [Rhizobium sp. PP-CC-3A-592]|nr:hypothetical protein C8J32_10426 [Rhizobium sp. PP-CC-3A-592]